MFDGTLTYGPQSKYDVPAGVYDVQFVGVEERKPFDNPGKFGKANPLLRGLPPVPVVPAPPPVVLRVQGVDGDMVAQPRPQVGWRTCRR